MSIDNLKPFPHTIGNLDDKPNLSAARMKAALEQDCLELWAKVAEMIPDLNSKFPSTNISTIVNATSTDSTVPTSKAVYNLVADALIGAGGTIATQIIDDWLTEHPEATTTVQDGAVTAAKLASNAVTDEKIHPNGLPARVADSRFALAEHNGVINFTLEYGGLYQATGVEYGGASSGRTRSNFIPVFPGERIYMKNASNATAIAIFEFADNTTTSDEGAGTNLVLNFYTNTAAESVYRVGNSTNYIRIMMVDSLENLHGNIMLARDHTFPMNFVTPSMFHSATNKTDAKLLQAAVNFALTNRCDVAIDRLYTLNSGEYILLNKYGTVSADRYSTRIFGLTGGMLSNDGGPGIKKESSGSVFITNDAYCWSGDFTFENLSFYSVVGAGTNVFDATRLMRFTVNNCFFKNVDSVCKNAPSAALPGDRDDYWQSVKFRDCTVIGGSGYAFYGTGCYDTLFDNVLIEHRAGGIRFGATAASYNNYYYCCRRLSITNCCIEGLSGKNLDSVSASGVPNYGVAINLDNPLSVNISGCYFEQNYKNIMLTNKNTDRLYTAHVSNCWLSGYFYKKRYGNQTTYQDIGDDNYLVTISGTKGQYEIDNNSSERGAIVNAPSGQDNVTILYNNNAKAAAAKGLMVYGSFTWDSVAGVWVGASAAADPDTVTSSNANESACLTYTTEALA